MKSNMDKEEFMSNETMHILCELYYELKKYDIFLLPSRYFILDDTQKDKHNRKDSYTFMESNNFTLDFLFNNDHKISILPVVDDGYHWSLLVYYNNDENRNFVYHYDSLGLESQYEHAKKLLIKYMTPVTLGRYNKTTLFNNNESIYIVNVSGFPEQKSNWECGYYVLSMIGLIVSRAKENIYSAILDEDIMNVIGDETMFDMYVTQYKQYIESYADKFECIEEVLRGQDKLTMNTNEITSEDVRKLKDKQTITADMMRYLSRTMLGVELLDINTKHNTEKGTITYYLVEDDACLSLLVDTGINSCLYTTFHSMIDIEKLPLSPKYHFSIPSVDIYSSNCAIYVILDHIKRSNKLLSERCFGVIMNWFSINKSHVFKPNISDNISKKLYQFVIGSMAKYEKTFDVVKSSTPTFEDDIALSLLCKADDGSIAKMKRNNIWSSIYNDNPVNLVKKCKEIKLHVTDYIENKRYDDLLAYYQVVPNKCISRKNNIVYENISINTLINNLEPYRIALDEHIESKTMIYGLIFHETIIVYPVLLQYDINHSIIISIDDLQYLSGMDNSFREVALTIIDFNGYMKYASFSYNLSMISFNLEYITGKKYTKEDMDEMNNLLRYRYKNED